MIYYNAQQLAMVFAKEILSFHKVSLSIISDRGTHFISIFWKTLHDEIGRQLTFVTTFNPQKTGQSERTIQLLEDTLREYIIDFLGYSDMFLALCEFSYNSNYHSSIYMATLKALYWIGYTLVIGRFEIGNVKTLGVY